MEKSKIHNKEYSLKYHNKRVALSREFTFDSAHKLLDYEGKCAKLHGHTYKIIITLSGFLKDNGMLIDFNDIKKIYEKAVNTKLDHEYLNEVLHFMNPTAENMIVWIWEQIEQELLNITDDYNSVRLEKLCLYETPTSYAIITRDWMDH